MSITDLTSIQETTKLPIVISQVNNVYDILRALNLPRETIASDDEIVRAWQELPREIKRIPREFRDGLIARMCIATSVGLFDGAINYIWNAVILNLRARAKSFGLGYISQTLNKKFEEDDLNDLMDSELIEMCYKLELLSGESYFFLNQCRDIRNNFSSAHPSIAQIDDRELITFISRCCKHGISADCNLKGINIANFIDTIKSKKLDSNAIDFWKESLEKTFPAQRTLLIPMMHGLYCDEDSKEETRINAIQICRATYSLFDSKVNSAIIEQHNNYKKHSEEKKIHASRAFLKNLDLLSLLTDAEKHSIIHEACTNLYRVHRSFDNFYNEPPFAQNLRNIAASTSLPETVREEYVETVITCIVGNQYGVSNAAFGYYQEMIVNFSPKEIQLLLKIPSSKTLVSERIKAYSNCKKRYKDTLNFIDPESLSPTLKARYDSVNKNLASK